MDRREQQLIKFGKHLKKLREAKGLNQIDLAFPLNTSTSYISRLENGKTEPGITVLLSLAEVLGCTACDLLNY